MKIFYTARFLKLYKKLNVNLREETKEKIELFKEDVFHAFLKTHELKGRLQGGYSFFVNYKYRIIFKYISEDKIAFLAIGDHDVYDK